MGGNLFPFIIFLTLFSSTIISEKEKINIMENINKYIDEIKAIRNIGTFVKIINL